MKNEALYLIGGLAALFMGLRMFPPKRNGESTVTQYGSALPPIGAGVTGQWGNTRGLRNNNPTNIRINAANAWKGKVSPNTDGAFEQFDTAENGLRAALILLRNYGASGRNTLRKVIESWAPKTENRTNEYIKYVQDATGIQPDTILTDAQRVAMIRPMVIMESGLYPYPPEVLTAAMKSAGYV